MSSKYDYEALSLNLIIEHNKVRTDPQSYIDKLESSLKYFRNEILSKPGQSSVKTFEGPTSYTEAIEFLKRQKPLTNLSHDLNLSKACLDHVNDIGPIGLASHESTDGKNVSDRIEKYCEWDGAISENIDFGTSTAEDIIINFIVDDGMPERPNRKNLFNPEFRFIGAACGLHKEFDIFTVVDYVNGVRALGEPGSSNFIQDYLKHSDANTNKEKNPFQEDDPDAPDSTVSVKIVKTTKIIRGKPKKITRKIYSLSNNSQHIVEIEDA